VIQRGVLFVGTQVHTVDGRNPAPIDR